MLYCEHCNNPLPEGSAFCGFCGNPVRSDSEMSAEQEFLNQTHRLLRWEKTAWRICGKVFLICGIVFGALFSLLSLFGAATGDDFGFGMSVAFFIYALIFGGMFIALGIVNRIAAGKVDQYLNSLYRDFRPTLQRCGSIGMLVFTVFFNEIALIFFLINFVRMKTNKRRIQQILSRQLGCE